MDKEFYVGYIPNAPSGLAKWLKRAVPSLIVILIIGAVLFGISQEDLPGITFEYGEKTTLQGTLVTDPFPVLQVSEGEQSKSILLVNLGKKGVVDIVKNWSDNFSVDPEGARIKVTGTLIYFDGMTILELTDSEQSLVSIEESNSTKSNSSDITSSQPVTLTGEILDSKCFFGVMNPGHGKTHRSCAVRCISGGIPPVFGTRQLIDGQNFYGIVVGPEGQVINDKLLGIIGKTITLSGTINQMNNLKYFQISDNELAMLQKNTEIVFGSPISLCIPKKSN